jgi:hypothetical protein
VRQLLRLNGLSFELRAGDCFDDMGYGWSDCENDRERTELKQVGNNRYGSTAWYGWHIFIPNTYENINPVKVALGQFHQRSAKPVFMFQNSYGGLHIDWQVRGNTKNKKPIISEEKLRGRWHQIEVHARWRKDEKGFFRVFVNGEKKFDHTGRTAKRSTYFKYGIYRSFISRYFEDGDIPTQVVYFAGVKKGATREDIQTDSISE